MAIITTTHTPVPIPFAYSGMADIIGQRTGVPRGEFAFSLDGADVTIAAGGDTQRLNIDCILPLGYAYVLREVMASYAAADAGDWDDNAWGGLQDAETNALRINLLTFALRSNGPIGLNTPRQVYTAAVVPKQVVYPIVPQEGAKLTCIFNNSVADGAAGFITFNARFLQFDVEQANHYAVNFPYPVR